MSAVTYRHVAGWVRAMTEKGLSPKTIANMHGLLSAAMTTAVRLARRMVSLPDDLVDVLLFTNTVGSQLSLTTIRTPTHAA